MRINSYLWISLTLLSALSPSSVFALTSMVSGQTVSGQVEEREWVYYQIASGSVPTDVYVQLTNLSADLDLHVRRYAQPTSSLYDCRPYEGGTTDEACVVSIDAVSTVYIGVYGYRASGFSLTATLSDDGTGGDGSDPGTGDPGTGDPGTGDPGTGDPGTGDPGTGDPGTGDPGTGDSGNSGDNTLVSGQAVSASVAQGEWTYYQVSSGSVATDATIELSGLSDDIDLYTRQSSPPSHDLWDCRPYKGGTTSETCTLQLGADSTAHIGVYGYRASSFTLTATLGDDGTGGGGTGDPGTGDPGTGDPGAGDPGTGDSGNTGDNTLVSGQAVSGEVDQGAWAYYQIVSGSVATNLTVELTNLNADIDLYVRENSQPNNSLWDCRPYKGSTNDESCTLQVAAATTIYIGIYGYRSSGFSLTATLEDAGTGGDGGSGGSSGDSGTGGGDNGNLTSAVLVSGSLNQGEWVYYNITAGSVATTVTVELADLSADLDLHVRNGSQPTDSLYDCRPYSGGTDAETCTMEVDPETVVHIGIRSYRTGNYSLTATVADDGTGSGGSSGGGGNAPSYKKAVLLLHGLSSNENTWNDLKDADEGFDGNCEIINIPQLLTTDVNVPLQNSEGIYCFRLHFGGYDIDSWNGPYAGEPGLDGLLCEDGVNGCSGDFSSLEELGEEVKVAVLMIKLAFGDDFRVVIVGHGRGGLAARMFLQGTSDLRSKVVGLVTMGTPHFGTTLGRLYAYMKGEGELASSACTPESDWTHPGYTGSFTALCHVDWLAAQRMRTPFEVFSGIDIRKPGVDLLSDRSDQIAILNNNVNVVNLLNIEFAQIIYTGRQFGELFPDYNLFPSTGVFGDQLSAAAEAEVLGSYTLQDLQGDGLVSADSQDLRNVPDFAQPIMTFEKDIAESYHSSSPTGETARVTDIVEALQYVYDQLGW